MNMNKLALGTGALLLAATLTACGGSADAPVAAKKSTAATAEAEPAGKATVVYGDATTDTATQGLDVLKSSGVMEAFTKFLNDTFKLPQDVTVAGEQCDAVNAFYTPDEKKITVCYELAIDGYTRYAEKAETDKENEEHGDANLLDTVYHELGHAVIDWYDLPALGKEDDAADQLSAYLQTLEIENTGDDSTAVQTITYYFDTAQDQDRASLPFYDEHSMDEQRAFNYMCWIYGSDPKAYASWVDDKEGLPEARAERCPGEYEKLSNAWNKLLEPHIKG
ncbi:DUF4344 domain-containing metallopeptidase [Nonomuraea sp. NPDC050556]|uniref:DUF4344 domain-containing metallopeptidase n=1 Tax=Nonomuraea sp. NPDC050556 TaxID=3364369 RepID=UPI0037B38163